jgi:hypothetical protein
MFPDLIGETRGLAYIQLVKLAISKDSGGCWMVGSELVGRRGLSGMQQRSRSGDPPQMFPMALLTNVIFRVYIYRYMISAAPVHQTYIAHPCKWGFYGTKSVSRPRNPLYALHQ